MSKLLYKLYSVQVVLRGKFNILAHEIMPLWEKAVQMNMWVSVNGYQDRAVWMSSANIVRFLFVWMDEEWRLEMKGGYTRRIAGLHFDAAASKMKREEQLRRTTRDHHTQDAKCTEGDGGSLECLLWSVTDLLFGH